MVDGCLGCFQSWLFWWILLWMWSDFACWIMWWFSCDPPLPQLQCRQPVGAEARLWYGNIFSSDMGHCDMPREGGSNSIFTVLRNYCSVFLSNSTTLHSHQQCTRVLVSPCLNQHLSLSILVIIAFLVGVKWCHIVQTRTGLLLVCATLSSAGLWSGLSSPDCFLSPWIEEL